MYALTIIGFSTSPQRTCLIATLPCKIQKSNTTAELLLIPSNLYFKVIFQLMMPLRPDSVQGYSKLLQFMI